MNLTADEILSYLKKGQKPDAKDPLVITPYPDLDKLKDSGLASIDLRLGTWFVTLRTARMPHMKIEDSTVQSQLSKTRYVPFGGAYYLHPRTFVLGITLQWIRLPKNLTAFVIGKSSWGRRGLIIATAIGVHPGFMGCLTLELTNVGEIPIEIKPGVEICQIFLQEVHETGASCVGSQFVGSRKPRFGDVGLDDIAKKLGEA